MDFINNSDHFDQHFLINNDILSKFIETSNLNKDDIVIEVGPGKEQLQKKLLLELKKYIVLN